MFICSNLFSGCWKFHIARDCFQHFECTRMCVCVERFHHVLRLHNPHTIRKTQFRLISNKTNEMKTQTHWNWNVHNSFCCVHLLWLPCRVMKIECAKIYSYGCHTYFLISIQWYFKSWTYNKQLTFEFLICMQRLGNYIQPAGLCSHINTHAHSILIHLHIDTCIQCMGIFCKPIPYLVSTTFSGLFVGKTIKRWKNMCKTNKQQQQQQTHNKQMSYASHAKTQFTANITKAKKVF